MNITAIAATIIRSYPLNIMPLGIKKKSCQLFPVLSVFGHQHSCFCKKSMLLSNQQDVFDFPKEELRFRQ